LPLTILSVLAIFDS